MRDVLTEREYAEIRSAVMASVRRRGRRRSTVWRWAFVPVAIALVIALLPHRREDVVPVPVDPPAVRQVVLEPPTPQSPVLEQQVAHKRIHHKKPQPIQTASVRIDMQTADPDVRIIWFAR